MSNRLNVALAVSALLQLFSASLFAQSSTQPKDLIVVTATRNEQKISDTILHTTLITAQDIRDSQAADVLTLLQREAGFEFVQSGGIGRTSSTFLRGTNSTQTLVLIDGVRMSSATTGATPLDQIMLDEIERIEIVRGNVSSIYGSEAIGGVIQIFTKRGRGAPALSASAGAGNRGTYRATGTYAGELDDTRFNFTVSELSTNGFSALRPSASPTADPDRDGYRNTSLAASISQRFGPRTRAGLSGFLTQGHLDFDNAFAASVNDKQIADTRVGFASVFVEHQPADSWSSRLTLSRGLDRYADRVNSTPSSRFQTTTDQAGWQNDIRLGAGQRLIAGLETRRQEISSDTAYTRNARNVSSALAGYTGEFGNHSVQANIRGEHYSDFGSATTYLGGYGYRLSDAWRLSAAASTAFRAPNFNELYYPFFGNPALQPERATSTEFGMQYGAGEQLARLVAFRTRIRDLIDGFPLANISRAEITGAEISYRGVIWGADVNASFTAQNPVDDSNGDNQPLLRRARRFAALSVQKTIGPWRLGGEIRGAGMRYDYNITAYPLVRESLAGYGVINLTARYQVTKTLALQFRADNVFDRDYQTAHGYNTQPSGFFVSLGYQP